MPPYTGRVPKPALSEAIQDYLKELYHLQSGDARVSVTASPAKGIDATLDWAVRLQADGLLQTTAILVENGKIGAIYVMRNPDKLKLLSGERQ